MDVVCKNLTCLVLGKSYMTQAFMVKLFINFFFIFTTLELESNFTNLPQQIKHGSYRKKFNTITLCFCVVKKLSACHASKCIVLRGCLFLVDFMHSTYLTVL